MNLDAYCQRYFMRKLAAANWLTATLMRSKNQLTKVQGKAGSAFNSTVTPEITRTSGNTVRNVSGAGALARETASSGTSVGTKSGIMGIGSHV